jgi:hypothetical protein
MAMQSRRSSRNQPETNGLTTSTTLERKCEVKRKQARTLQSWPAVFLVELPGIEPASLPGDIHAELQLRYISIQLSPARYLWFRFRVLTASRAATDFNASFLHPLLDIRSPVHHPSAQLDRRRAAAPADHPPRRDGRRASF